MYFLFFPVRNIAKLCMGGTLEKEYSPSIKERTFQACFYLCINSFKQAVTKTRTYVKLSLLCHAVYL